MLSSIYSAKRRGDDGFTLIELLIVVIIIGILAAIALPIFIDQSRVAVDASVQSDVRNTVTNITNAQAQDSATAKAAVSNADTKVALTAVPRGSAAGASATVAIATKADSELGNVPALGTAYSLQGWNAGGKKYLGSADAGKGGFGFDSSTGQFTQVSGAAPEAGASTGGGNAGGGGSSNNSVAFNLATTGAGAGFNVVHDGDVWVYFVNKYSNDPALVGAKSLTLGSSSDASFLKATVDGCNPASGNTPDHVKVTKQLEEATVYVNGTQVNYDSAAPYGSITAEIGCGNEVDGVDAFASYEINLPGSITNASGSSVGNSVTRVDFVIADGGGSGTLSK